MNNKMFKFFGVLSFYYGYVEQKQMLFSEQMDDMGRYGMV